MSCTIDLRSPRNMCSVRHSPIPAAPNERPRAASSGVSALARTPRRRNSSAQPKMVSKSPETSGVTRSTAPSTTAPVVPLIEIMSPSASTVPVPETTARFLPASILSDSAPHTHGLPMPRATTAACEVLPPCEVRIPSAAIMPCRSSGVVSQRTKMTLRPSATAATASSAVKTTSPTAAPGEALRPLAIAS